MLQTPVYLDNHATTRVDPRVLDRMLPFFGQVFGNPASTSHAFGWQAKEAVEAAREQIAQALGAAPREIVFTSGATESNNLAIRGVCERLRGKGKHVLSLATEHKAVLEPLEKLAARGCEITLLPVRQQTSPEAGLLDLDQLAGEIRPDTALVSVMLANNEIGVLQPLREIGRLCRQRGVLLHTDATQAVGRIPVDVEELQVDLMSFSAHKMYGPKGIGALYVRRRNPAVRLQAQIDGGRHEQGLRSGTLNVPGIVGLAAALTICVEELPGEMVRLRSLRDRLYEGLLARTPDVTLNGPALSRPELRLPGNLNCCFAGVDGETLLINMRDVAVSTGSACTSANPEPSHVLRALGLSDEQTHASLRFGLGRFTTPEEIEFAVGVVSDTVARLRRLGSES
jgi:cysteine desulfurase